MVLAALSDPVRWQLIGELGRSDRRVGELVESVGKPQNVVSYHLKELRTAGLVVARRSSADGRDIYYRADLHRCRALLGDAGLALHPGLGLTPTRARVASQSGKRRKLLFLCTGNSARSQIAEALAVHCSGGHVDAFSAGSHPKDLHPNALRVMAERGLETTGRYSKSLDMFATASFDRVITLCDKVREVCPQFNGAPVSVHWSIPDPAAGGGNDTATYPAFVDLANDLAERMSLLLVDLGILEAERSSHA